MFIDLVVCKYPLDHNRYLYIAPAFSHFKEGTEVVVQDSDEKRNAIVVDCATFTLNDDKYQFVVKALNAETPLKRIVEKVVYHSLSYKWEEGEEV